MQKFNVTLIIISISLLASCSSKDAILPVPNQSMQQVYDSHMGGATDANLYDSRTLLKRGMYVEEVNLSRYVRSEANQLRSRFKRIPNPTMFMFVAPHLASKSNVPVPGYLTEFKMWESDNYALPGEVSDMSSFYETQMKLNQLSNKQDKGE